MNTIKGDLIELAEAGYFDVIVHGCNCFCTMGSGIARTISDRYPQVYAADCKTRKGDNGKLNSFTFAEVGTDYKFVVVNAYTQVRYNQTRYRADLFEYDSFCAILDKLVLAFPGKRFGFPMIGMERAGGDKTRILNILSEFSVKLAATRGSVTLVEYDGVVNK
jgi:O-acetyl-ADP-ribose deacetylase (regulator of RNase III)